MGISKRETGTVCYRTNYLDEHHCVSWNIDPSVDSNEVWNNKIDLCPDSSTLAKRGAHDRLKMVKGCGKELSMKTAYLSNQGRYTIFSCGEDTLRFIAPYSLERYEEVKEWDHGYLVVLAKYSHNADLEEDYIDLIPILQSLYMDEESFLSEIDKVEVKYA